MICHTCGGENRHIRWCQDYKLEVVYKHTTPRARNTDPTTSHQAAATITRTAVTDTQRMVLDALQAHGPLTDEQLCQRIAEVERKPVSVSGVRTRRSELVTDGRVIDTGDRQPTRAGRQAIVWGLA
jgi:hypothetical protein